MLANNAYLMPPKPAPNHRLTSPSWIALMTWVSKEAIRERPIGTINQMRMKAMI